MHVQAGSSDQWKQDGSLREGDVFLQEEDGDSDDTVKQCGYVPTLSDAAEQRLRKSHDWTKDPRMAATSIH